MRLSYRTLGQSICEIPQENCSCRFPSCIGSYGGRSKFAYSIMLLQSHMCPTCQPDSNTTCSIFRTFRNEAILVHGDKVHSILEEIGIEDDETMFAVLIMDDERLNGMLQEAKRLNLVEKYSVIQALRNFGEKHKIAR